MAQKLGDLPVGALIRDDTSLYLDTPVIWKVADKNHAGYPEGAVTLITERSIAILCSDAREPNNSDSDRKLYGNSRYAVSNIRQWLNSGAGPGEWYTAQHSVDQAPETAYVHGGINPYDTKASFLHGFSRGFKEELLETTLTVGKIAIDGGGSETVTDKIFLASLTEVGLGNENNIAEGSRLTLFTSDASRIAYVTTEAIVDSTYAGNPADNATAHTWWLRTVSLNSPVYIRQVNNLGEATHGIAHRGYYGIRPLCNLPASIQVSNDVGDDGCYVIIFNEAPTIPAKFTGPEAIYSGVAAWIEWEPSTDPEGDHISYVLERSTDGEFTKIYAGENCFFEDTVTADIDTVCYRVKAIDEHGNESDYQTGETYTVIHNQAPFEPSFISVIEPVFSGQELRVEWGEATDPDGDDITYILQRSYNNGAYGQVYEGEALFYNDSITTDMNTVRYRVKATDDHGNESGYQTSETYTVIHNQPPVISGEDGDLGVFGEGVKYQYTLSDPEEDEITVIEAVDGAPLNRFTAQPNATYTLTVAGHDWVKLIQGSHILTITAVDIDDNIALRTMTFTKQAEYLSCQWDTKSIPVFDTRPRRVTINLDSDIAQGAEVSIFICNNAFDPEPAWEDATAAVTKGYAHLFTNNKKTAVQWGFNIRVSVNKKNSADISRLYDVNGYIECEE